MRKDAKENRQRIEEIARRLFDGEGVESIGMDHTAKGLGIGMGTLYRHFKDKGDLCYYVIQRDLDIFIAHFKQIKDGYHPNYEVVQVSLDYLLQFKVDNKALLQCIEAGNNKLRFYQSVFYRGLFDFYYDLFKSNDGAYTKFKVDILLQSLSTSILAFQIKHHHVPIEVYRNYLLNIYLDEVGYND